MRIGPLLVVAVSVSAATVPQAVRRDGDRGGGLLAGRSHEHLARDAHAVAAAAAASLHYARAPRDSVAFHTFDERAWDDWLTFWYNHLPRWLQRIWFPNGPPVADDVTTATNPLPSSTAPSSQTPPSAPVSQSSSAIASQPTSQTPSAAPSASGLHPSPSAAPTSVSPPESSVAPPASSVATPVSSVVPPASSVAPPTSSVAPPVSSVTFPTSSEPPTSAPPPASSASSTSQPPSIPTCAPPVSLLKEGAPAGGFELVGDSGVSAQMMFLGSDAVVYILDKVEDNPVQINGHPAWVVRYDLLTNEVTPMDVYSNTFCAGGMALGNGSWLVVGGNAGGDFQSISGTNKLRMISPMYDDHAEWVQGGYPFTMTTNRWYPAVEGLADGSVFIIGGQAAGGFVSTPELNNPTYEFWPKRDPADKPVHLQFLVDTVPVNLFPLTWLLPSGKLFMQAGYKSQLYNMDTLEATALPDMPYAQRLYPASAAAVMLPLTPENDYKTTVLFCGGSNAYLLNATADDPIGYNITAVRADDSCVRISPDDPAPFYEDDDRLPEGRVMGSFIYLPDGTMWLGNGAEYGLAGYGPPNYGEDPYDNSYAQVPIYTPVMYNPSAPKGTRFNREGLSPSGEERLYHSTAILLGDSSVMVSGSNPNFGVTYTQWATKYSVERWYPTWYNEPRPQPSCLPDSLSYGGAYWSFSLPAANTNPEDIKVVVIRTGFASHAINWGQRFLELRRTYTVDNATNQILVHVSQMPTNPNLFTPGPAQIFVTVKGIPSQGKTLMIGNGQMGQQPIAETTVLPPGTGAVEDASII